MKHSDYMILTRRLAFFAKEADRERALLTMPLYVTRDGDIVATLTPDQDGTPIEANRAEIWRAVEAGDNNIAGWMDSLVDGFVEANQERADQGNPATADIRGLIQAMEGFMSATSTPVPGWGVLYDKTRQRVRDWMDQVYSLFPGLNDQGGNQESRPTSTPAKVDREKMANLFIPKFRDPDPATRVVPFDNLCNSLESGDFTPKDIGRIAYQVQNSRVVLPKYKRGKTTFAQFARLFYEFCGVPVPKDLAPRAYKDRTDKTDFDCWLN